MNRRDAVLAFLTLGIAPFARSQQAAGPKRVGYLRAAGSKQLPADSPQLKALRQGLGSEDFTEGRNLAFEWRSAEGKVELLRPMVDELVAAKPNALLIETTPGVRAALDAAPATPIVFIYVSDPVGSGFAKSLARPGGKATGVSNILPELSGKLLGLLKEVRPGAQSAGVLWNPGNAAKKLEYEELAKAAAKTGFRLVSHPVRSLPDIESAFSAMAGENVSAVIGLAESLTHTHREAIAALALKHRLPSVFNINSHAEAGGLIAYSSSDLAMYSRAGAMLGKILNGANPAELPIERPTTFELFVNLRTAKQLGITVPQSVLLRADRVID